MKKMLALLPTIAVLSINFTSIVACETFEIHKKKNHHFKDSDLDQGRWSGSDWEDNKTDNPDNPDNPDEKNKDEGQANDDPIDPEASEYQETEGKNKKVTKNKNFFIVDLEDKQTPVQIERNLNGTLMDPNSRIRFEEKQLKRKITSEENDVIEKFTNALQFKASQNSINKFNFFIKSGLFQSFDELVKKMDSYNKSHQNLYLDVPLELFKKHATEKEKFENAILKAYNTISSFFGKDYGFRMVNALTMFKPDANNNINGQTSTGLDFKITVSSNIVSRTSESAKKEWLTGSKSTSHPYKTFVHEMGHVVYNFHNFTNLDRANTWFFSGLNNDYSKNEFFNKEKEIICAEWQKKQPTEDGICKYRKSDLNTPVSEKYYKIESSKIPKEGSIDQNEELKKFLIQRIKNFRFPGRKISEKNNLLMKY